MKRLISIALVCAASCGGVSEEDPCTAANPDEALDCLGVPPDDSKRGDRVGSALPDTYSPLGPTRATGVSKEFFLVGMQIAPLSPLGEPEPVPNRGSLVEFADDSTGAIGPGVLDLTSQGTIWENDTSTPHPGLGPSNAGAETTRAAVATDLDGDGIEERVVVYLDTDDPANVGVIFAEIIGGRTSVIGALAGARDVTAVAGDFDGDGAVELAVGVSSGAASSVFVVGKDAADELSLVAGSGRNFSPTLPSATQWLELAAGNIDRDNGEELVVVHNEFASRSSGATRYFVYDDAAAGFAAIIEDAPISARDQGTFTAEVADVTIGDIDGDGKGEIVFAGLEELHDLGCSPYRHIYLAIDDGGDTAQPFAVLGESAPLLRHTEQSGCSEVSTILPLRHVFINALDIDNDGVDEIQANLRVFEDFRVAAFSELFAIDDAVFAGPDGRGGGYIAPATVDIAVSDVNGDDRDDIVIFAQHRDEIVVWGLDGATPETAIFRQMTSLATATYNSQSRVFPIVVPVNVDSDGVVLKYSDVEYKFVFTEPILIAAIAAAPCKEGIGQNVAACVTSYGLSEASNGGLDASVSVRASVFVSFEAKDPFFGIGVEGKDTITASASFSAEASYSLEESVEYATGSIEDTVVFTTVPLDQYTYTIVAHPDPTLVGTEVVVNLPRRPITLQVERAFYNQSVAPGSFLVDASVFAHTPGDIDSYPTEAEATARTADGRGLKATRAVTVGQGTGQTTTELAFTEETTYRAGAEISYDRELAVTGGGVGVGGSIGGTLGAGISWGTSTSTIYRGTIGSISGESFADNLYSAGLFTYIHNGGDSSAQQFEVVNYWVEK